VVNKMASTLPDFPEGIQQIVRDERKRISREHRDGPNDFRPEEHGAKLVVEKIKNRGLSGDENYGIQPKGEILNAQTVPDLSKNSEALEWAAEQYFKLLLTDLQRCPEFFLDHQSCQDC
jgi:hypothetical protein